MTEFTKGPWVAKRGTNFWGFECKEHGKLGNVASSAFRGSEKISNAEEVMKANAHLIAAAPELYEALDSLVRITDDGFNLTSISVGIQIARAALAKARGEA